VSGEKHPSTSIAAWNLFQTLLGLRDDESATTVLKRDLLLLLDP
jgi:hypothetical protein